LESGFVNSINGSLLLLMMPWLLTRKIALSIHSIEVSLRLFRLSDVVQCFREGSSYCFGRIRESYESRDMLIIYNAYRLQRYYLKN